MDRYECREKVTDKMESLGHFVEVADRKIPIKHSDRSKTPIEPYLIGPVVRQDGRPGPSRDGCGFGWPREVLSLAVREDLSGLARRKTRLVHQQATLVGPPDSGLVHKARTIREDGVSAGGIRATMDCLIFHSRLSWIRTVKRSKLAKSFATSCVRS